MIGLLFIKEKTIELNVKDLFWINVYDTMPRTVATKQFYSMSVAMRSSPIFFTARKFSRFNHIMFCLVRCVSSS